MELHRRCSTSDPECFAQLVTFEALDRREPENPPVGSPEAANCRQRGLHILCLLGRLRGPVRTPSTCHFESPVAVSTALSASL